MRRFRVRPEDIVADRVTFDAEETRHLTRVLRLGAGDIVEALDGAGSMLTVRIERVSPRRAGAPRHPFAAGAASDRGPTIVA